MGIEDDHPRGQVAPGAPQPERREMLSGDDVGVGDDEAIASDPAAALDAGVAGGSEDPYDRAPRGGNPPRPDDPPAWRGHVGDTTADAGQRVDAAERVQDRTRWRQRAVEVSQDHGAGEAVAEA